MNYALAFVCKLIHGKLITVKSDDLRRNNKLIRYGKVITAQNF